MVGMQVSTSLAGAEELAKNKASSERFLLGLNKLLENCLKSCATHPSFVAFICFGLERVCHGQSDVSQSAAVEFLMSLRNMMLNRDTALLFSLNH